MSNVVAGAGTKSIGDLKPGQWQIRMVKDYRCPDGPVPHLFFGCVNRRGLCGVPIAPSPPNANGAVWQWDGEKEMASLSPSIHCLVAKGGCGFHGFLTNGVLR